MAHSATLDGYKYSRSYTYMQHVFMLFQHLPIILDFVYLSTFQDSNILMVSSLFQCFQWSPYVLIVWMAFQTHSEIFLMLFLLLWHFIYFYITAFVFKLRNYLENRETSSPLFTTVITLQLHPPSTLWLIAQAVTVLHSILLYSDSFYCSNSLH